MYKVELTGKCQSELKKHLKDGKISNENLLIIRSWIQEMTLYGPDYIENCDYWGDHALRGTRSGQRSSWFSLSGRIIYKIYKNKIVIRVLKITPDHDYGR